MSDYLEISRKEQSSSAHPQFASQAICESVLFFYNGSNTDVIIYRWIEAQLLKKDPTNEQLFALGVAMAILHQLSKGWQPSGYTNFLEVDRSRMVRRDNLFSFERPLISLVLYKLLFELNNRSEQLFESLKARFDRQLIHANLHFGNVLYNGPQMSILDFDDAGIGSPLQDLAISIYYLCETTTADDLALIPDFLEKTEGLLKHFFETGQFSQLM